MHKLVFAVLTAFALNVSAQETKRATVEVVCLELPSAVESLEKNYKEQVSWSGTGKNITYLLFSNNTTKTWSLGMTDGTVYCSLGEGTGFVDVKTLTQ